eukprot:TRINITY_DN2982_c0_g1_i1.p1 TRINITY_DN2982_c0_g1~~TRINITY_DN2982_c0_g1_i1.p1  ORF type:complete len:206 (-),score=46.75 TRINITY_DN2982_c0_g1_i1:28-645(-)
MLFVFALCLFAVSTFAEDVSPVSVHFYAMSKCPYASFLVSQFQQNTMSFAGIADITNVTIDYIAQVNASSPSGFSSKHGPGEVEGDFLELCIRQTQPEKLWPVLVCAYAQYSQVPNNLKQCALQAKVDWTLVNNCYTVQRAALLKESIAATDALQITNSPTLYINGACVYGTGSDCNNMDPQSNMMLQYICSSYKGTKPAGCSSQ